MSTPTPGEDSKQAPTGCESTNPSNQTALLASNRKAGLACPCLSHVEAWIEFPSDKPRRESEEFISQDFGSRPNPENVMTCVCSFDTAAAVELQFPELPCLLHICSDNVDFTLTQEHISSVSESLESIVLPKKTRKIGDGCFADCSSLSCVICGSNSVVESFGVNSFSGDCAGVQVKTLHVPGSVREIGDECFCDCEELENVIFGCDSKLERIGERAFSGKNGCSMAYVDIPDSVRMICSRCFYCATSLVHVKFGKLSMLEVIDEGAFLGSSIQTMEIPAGVKTLGDGCFFGCQALVVVCFPENSVLEVIGSEAFACTSITNLSIPSSVREIRDRCFAGCEHLRRVSFGRNSVLASIGVEAFRAVCITTFHAPKTLVSVGDQCFQYCASLVSVTFDRDSAIHEIGCDAFAMSGVYEIEVPAGTLVLDRSIQVRKFE